MQRVEYKLTEHWTLWLSERMRWGRKKTRKSVTIIPLSKSVDNNIESDYLSETCSQHPSQHHTCCFTSRPPSPSPLSKNSWKQCNTDKQLGQNEPAAGNFPLTVDNMLLIHYLIMLSDILASQSEALAAGNSIYFSLPTSGKDFDQAGQIQVLYLNGTSNNFSKKKKKKHVK